MITVLLIINKEESDSSLQCMMGDLLSCVCPSHTSPRRRGATVAQHTLHDDTHADNNTHTQPARSGAATPPPPTSSPTYPVCRAAACLWALATMSANKNRGV